MRRREHPNNAPIIRIISNHGNHGSILPLRFSARGTRRAQRDAGGCPASQTPTKDSNYQHAIIVHHSNHSHHNSPTAKASPQPLARAKGEIPRFARNDIGTRRNDIGAQCEGGSTRTTHPSFASFPIMAITVQKSPFAPRKGDAASAARRRGMPCQQNSDQRLQLPTRHHSPSFQSFPSKFTTATIIRIIRIISNHGNHGSKLPLRSAQGGRGERSETQGDALPAKLRPRTPTTNTPS